jgi:predicted RNA-binding Zn-ribbon protein involved in translation (DUF1610 family)
MALRELKSMDECVYFTNRTIGNGKAVCWVFRETCPKCKKGVVGKPKDKKGKVLMRAKEYVCPNCGFTMQKQEYEDTLTANVSYTCPHCGNKGEAQVPFKRKKIDGIDTLRVKCAKCNANIDITKKMKSKGESNEAA